VLTKEQTANKELKKRLEDIKTEHNKIQKALEEENFEYKKKTKYYYDKITKAEILVVSIMKTERQRIKGGLKHSISDLKELE
jgi:aminopeptidase C